MPYFRQLALPLECPIAKCAGTYTTSKTNEGLLIKTKCGADNNHGAPEPSARKHNPRVHCSVGGAPAVRFSSAVLARSWARVAASQDQAPTCGHVRTEIQLALGADLTATTRCGMLLPPELAKIKSWKCTLLLRRLTYF